MFSVREWSFRDKFFRQHDAEQTTEVLKHVREFGVMKLPRCECKKHPQGWKWVSADSAAWLFIQSLRLATFGSSQLQPTDLADTTPFFTDNIYSHVEGIVLKWSEFAAVSTYPPRVALF
jgi:hypothetical protein